MDNLAQKVNQMRVQDAPARGRGRGRGRGGPAGPRRESTHKPVEVPTEDYDFESANAKFNKQDLVKQQIASGEPMPSQQNGAVPEPASNGHTEVEDVVIPAKPGAEKGYDKQSSFFDNISSDLKDRQVAQDGMIDGRAMRRDERNKNVDTFGQGSVDNGYRGGFRGRGRGGRGFARGGPRGGGFAPRGRGGRGGAGEPALV
jgi:protein LSM14